MFGNHDYEAAVRLAAEKAKELGRSCTVFPSEEEPGKFTIGVAIKATSGAEFLDRIKAKLSQPKKET
jgi:hypothetical protein